MYEGEHKSLTDNWNDGMRGGEHSLKDAINDFVEKRIQDFSTPEEFRFGITCELCGDTLTTIPVRFIKAGEKPETDGKKVIYETMYQRDRQLERDAATRALVGQLNYCPVCKRIVCNHCFVMTGDLDICTDCAKRLGVTGTPVVDTPDELQRKSPPQIIRISARADPHEAVKTND